MLSWTNGPRIFRYCWQRQRQWQWGHRLLSFLRERHDGPWRPVIFLADGNIQTFQGRCFSPAVPALLPRGIYASLPAATKWFRMDRQGRGQLQLDTEYLLRFGDPLVPLELTRPSPGDPDGSANSFQRFTAPLSLFVEWTSRGGRDTDRLYLAQASTSDLPNELRDDLPVPDVVLYAGKGDIYNSNLWMGLAPTYTPLHRDPNPNLFVQLAGTKVVRLCHPEVGASMFRQVQHQLGRNASAVFRDDEMMHGPEKKALEELIWGFQAADQRPMSTTFEAYIRPGDGLFIPKGWWHSMKGIGSGVTASVRNLFSSFITY